MKRVLLVIGVQNEYFSGKLPVSYPPGSLDNIIKAINTANYHEIPIILIQHTSPHANSKTFRKGSPEWNLHPEIALKQFSHYIEKNFPCSFIGTNLEHWLKERNIDTITISGYLSNMCCDSTAKQASQIGFSVEFLSDATGTLQIYNYAGTVKDDELHKSVLVTQAMRFSKVLTTSEWIKMLKIEYHVYPI